MRKVIKIAMVIFGIGFIAGTTLFGRTYNFHCADKLEACQEHCDNTSACIHNGSQACMRCYRQCEEANEACLHYQNDCAPQFQQCIRESYGDETLKRECRKEYLRCKGGH